MTLAAMEGLFHGGPYAELAIIGQPDVRARRLENPVVVPGILSFLAYGTFGSTVKGLNDFPADEWPHNVELLYYTYHIMVGLGTILTLVMSAAAFFLWRGSPAPVAPDALDADAVVPVPLHRDDRRLVDGRAGPPALDHLRAPAHPTTRHPRRSTPGTWSSRRSASRACICCSASSSCPGSGGDRARPGVDAARRRPWKRSGSPS